MSMSIMFSHEDIHIKSMEDIKFMNCFVNYYSYFKLEYFNSFAEIKYFYQFKKFIM